MDEFSGQTAVWEYEGENYRLAMRSDGVLLELTDEEYLGDDGVYEEFTRYERIIPYDRLSFRLCVIRNSRAAAPDFRVFMDVNIGEGAFDGDIEMPFTQEFLAAADRLGVGLANRELLERNPPEKEKPKKVFRQGRSPLAAFFWLLPGGAAVLGTGGYYLLAEQAKLWPFLAAAAFFVVSFVAFWATYRPYVKIEFFGEYIGYFVKCRSVTFVDKRAIEYIDVADDGETIVVYTAAEYFEARYDESLWKYLKQEVPGAEFTE